MVLARRSQDVQEHLCIETGLIGRAFREACECDPMTVRGPANRAIIDPALTKTSKRRMIGLAAFRQR